MCILSSLTTCLLIAFFFFSLTQLVASWTVNLASKCGCYWLSGVAQPLLLSYICACIYATYILIAVFSLLIFNVIPDIFGFRVKYSALLSTSQIT